MSAAVTVLRFSEQTRKLDFYEKWYAILWRVDEHPDDWLDTEGAWTREKSERALYATRTEALNDMPRRRLGHPISTKLVRVYRRVK